MINQKITRVSLESFHERSAGKKIILLYPWTQYRNLFLSHFLASGKQGLLYYRIPNDDMSLQAWLSDMKTELGDVLPDFGSHLDAAQNSDAAELGKALADDLNSFNGDKVTLFIDELDRIKFDENFNTFVEALVAGMANNRQIAFSSRLLTHQPWYSMVANGDAVILGTEYRKNDVMFTVEDGAKPQLEVYAFGRGHALINGQEVTNWDGALPRNLFFYFMDNLLVTRDDIFATFWPNLSIKEATNVFHVTKRKISERLGMKMDNPEEVELTQYSSGFYMPSDRIVRHFDVQDFQEAVEYAATVNDVREEERLYRRAVDLYKAPYLETVDMPWVEERRNHLKQLHAQALVGLGRIYREANRKEEALGVFTRTLREVPEREDIHREVMQLYIEMDMREDARQQYHYLSQVLDNRFGIAPSKEIRSLYESINNH